MPRLKKALIVIDLQKEFAGFRDQPKVLRYVANKIKTGGYTRIFNVMYDGYYYASPLLEPIAKAMAKNNKKVVNVIKATNGGAGRILERAKQIGVDLSKMQIDVVGVNIPYCVEQTIQGLLRKGYKVNLLRKGASTCRGSYRDEKQSILWMKRNSKIMLVNN